MNWHETQLVLYQWLEMGVAQTFLSVPAQAGMPVPPTISPDSVPEAWPQWIRVNHIRKTIAVSVAQIRQIEPRKPGEHW
jgi:hypothetical protein